LLHPSFNGNYEYNSLRNDFIEKLASQTKTGLFPIASRCRNKYDIVAQSEKSLHFRSTSLLTGIHIGLNDVHIQVDESTNRIQYDVTFWTWAKFCVSLSLGVVFILGFFLTSHLFGLYIFPDFEYPSMFEIEMYIVPMIIFWGLIWPWILIYRHKKPAAECLIRIFEEVNSNENGIVKQKTNNKNIPQKYKTWPFWRSIFVCAIVVVVLLAIINLIHRRWILGPAHRGYPPSGILLPDQKLPRKQETRPGVDLVTTTPNDFPEFLGKGRHAAIEHIKLNPDWKNNPPKLLWRQLIGSGWSAFSIVNEFAVTMEQRGPYEQVACYALKSGQHHWTVSWNERFFLFGIGPRSTPTIANGKVYALGTWGHLACIEGNTGKVIWQRELLKDLGISWSDENREIKFGRSNSPLVTDKLVIVPGGGLPGKCSSLLAYDKETGKLIWRGGKQQISYSSPVLAEILQEKQVLIVNENTVSGHNPETGVELWSYPWPSNSNTDANVSQPVSLPGNRILISKGYRRGAVLIELLRQTTNNPIEVRTVWSNSKVLRTKFTNIVIWKDHAYGLSDGRLECVNLKTGQQCWKKGRYGHGQILRVNDLLLILSEKGKLLLVRLNSKSPNEVLGSLQALTGTTWNNIALYGRFLLIRNASEAACYELPIGEH
jgi:outer membrane protein assembly factor BamB